MTDDADKLERAAVSEILHALRAAWVAVPCGGVWRHRKGGTYEVRSHVVRESDRAVCVVYQCHETGIPWCRPVSEFLDGRFTRVGA